MASTLSSLFLTGLAVQGVLAAPPRGKPGRPQHGKTNLVMVIPDGLGLAHQTFARNYASLVEGAALTDIEPLAADHSALGTVRTHSFSDLITDSAGAGTAFATGFKTNNGVIGLNSNLEPIANILEAAKLAGYKTGLVATSIINHATPASYSAHVEDRNDYDTIAAQQIGHSHPLGHVVDVLLGGGRCYFKPQNDSSSCRSDDLDLFGWAKSEGWTVMEDLSDFEEHSNGAGPKLPFIGTFSDGDLMYEADRARTEEEPSLLDMSKVALESLEAATERSEKGFFLMIEASRIDHASHANDPVGILHDTLEYNRVVQYVRKQIDRNPETILMGSADHETGGLTLVDDYDPSAIQAATATAETIEEMWDDYNGTDGAAYLTDTLLPLYGLEDLSAEEVDELIANDDLAADIASTMSERIGVNWGTGSHTYTDVELFGYGHARKGDQLKIDMAGGHDNTELMPHQAKLLGVNVEEATRKLRAGLA